MYTPNAVTTWNLSEKKVKKSAAITPQWLLGYETKNKYYEKNTFYSTICISIFLSERR